MRPNIVPQINCDLDFQTFQWAQLFKAASTQVCYNSLIGNQSRLVIGQPTTGLSPNLLPSRN